MGLVTVAASSALVLGACGGGDGTAAHHPGGTAQGGGNPGVAKSSCAAASDVLSNTQTYAGKQVTITGKIDRVVGPHAFTVAATNPSTSGNQSNAQGSGTQSLLAVDKESTPLTPGSPVELTGTLQPTFDTNQAKTFAGGNLDEAAFTAYNGQPYVQTAFAGPESANLASSGQSNGILNGGNSGNSCAAASDVLSNTQTYAGKQVTITGKIDRVVGPHAFTVAATNPSTSGNQSNAQGSGTQSLLAISKESTPLTPGSPVELTGTLQPTFDTNQAKTFAGGNLDEAAFTAFNGQPYVQTVFAGPVSANLTGAQSNNGG